VNPYQSNDKGIALVTHINTYGTKLAYQLKTHSSILPVFHGSDKDLFQGWNLHQHAHNGFIERRTRRFVLQSTIVQTKGFQRGMPLQNVGKLVEFFQVIGQTNADQTKLFQPAGSG